MRGKKTGGRQKGTPNKTTAEQQAEIAASGLTPLEHMMNVLRDPNTPPARRDDMAKAAAPYVHPRLSQVESKNEHIHRYIARVPEKAVSAEKWQDQHQTSPLSGKPSQAPRPH
mgnify:CR=1 FL=1